VTTFVYNPLGASFSANSDQWTTTQLNGLTSTQLGALNNGLLTALTTTQIGMLTTTQLSGLTATQRGALVMVGDSGSGGVAGFVTAPASGDAAVGKYFKADGTWSTPAGSGGVVSIRSFSSDLTIASGNQGETLLHPSYDSIRTITIPLNSVTALPVGFSFNVINMSVDPVSITSTAQVADSAGGMAVPKKVMQYGEVSVKQISVDAWEVSGTGLFSPNISGVEYLVIAGGGGGGTSYGCGGGSGGYRTNLPNEVSGQSSRNEPPKPFARGVAYTVTIGAGGSGSPGGTATGSSGNASAFGGISTTGGGYGAGGANSSIAGGNGGAGGGSWSGVPGSGSLFQGMTGVVGGGGAGAGAANVTTTGGAGLSSTITGSSVTRGGGGGRETGGVGGAGGGGNGGDTSNNGGNGSVNTGAGGGGGVPSKTAGNGGSGVVIIRFPSTEPAASTTGSPTHSTPTGYHCYTFTSSGTITFN